MLTEQQLLYFKRNLSRLKTEAETRIEQNDHFGMNLGSWHESMGELSSYDNHPADAGTELFERGKDLALNEHLEEEIKDISKALRAIDEGTYGKCEVCSTVIPLERLEALPTTTFCIEHSDDQKVSNDRPIEEEILTPPYGRFVFEGQDENVGFDAEDSWQAVGEWGTSESPSDLIDPPHDYGEVYIDSGENIGYVEGYENFVGVDMEGKQITIFPTAEHEKYEDMLDEEGIMTPFGDLTEEQNDPLDDE